MGSYSIFGEYPTQILIVWGDFGFKKATDYIKNYLMK